jgi:general secretion pathway protein A
MYERFYKLKEKPFALMPDPGFLFLGKKHRVGVSMLEYGLLNQAGFVVISGGIGTGKTTLIHQLINGMNRRTVNVGLISNAHPSFGELMEWVLMAFDLKYVGKGKTELFETFGHFMSTQFSKGRRTVLIIDEAQNLSVDTLEELRMLLNVNAGKTQMLQVLLVGQEQLLAKLQLPELEQFAQRVSVCYRLPALDLDETRDYIRHRLSLAGCQDGNLFTDEACAEIYRHSAGIPRLINVLCDTALVYGFADESPQIGADLVRDVAKDRAASGLARLDASG